MISFNLKETGTHTHIHTHIHPSIACWASEKHAPAAQRILSFLGKDNIKGHHVLLHVSCTINACGRSRCSI